MTKLFIISFSLVIMCATIFSCASKKDAAGGGETLQVDKGHIFEIKLKANPSTGYSWMLSQPLDSTVIEFNKKDYIADGDPNKPMIGGGGTEIWTFTGLNKGKTTIRMKYARSWEDDEKVKTKNFMVKVK